VGRTGGLPQKDGEQKSSGIKPLSGSSRIKTIKNYDQKFKEQAVHPLQTSGRSLRQIANESGSTSATYRVGEISD